MRSSANTYGLSEFDPLTRRLCLRHRNLAGIATQMLVERALRAEGQDRRELGREKSAGGTHPQLKTATDIVILHDTSGL